MVGSHQPHHYTITQVEVLRSIVRLASVEVEAEAIAGLVVAYTPQLHPPLDRFFRHLLFPGQSTIEANHRLVDGQVLSWSKAALGSSGRTRLSRVVLSPTCRLPSLHQPQNNGSTGPVSHTGDAPSHWDLWSPKIIFRVPLTHTPSQRCCRHSQHAMLLSTLLYDNQSNLVSQDFEKPWSSPPTDCRVLQAARRSLFSGAFPVTESQSPLS